MSGLLPALMMFGAALGADPSPSDRAPTGTAPVSASEREVLAYTLEEFVALERLLIEAERRAEPDARIFIDYAALRRDLQEVKLGIRQYLGEERPQPRAFVPLEADYVRSAK